MWSITTLISLGVFALAGHAVVGTDTTTDTTTDTAPATPAQVLDHFGLADKASQVDSHGRRPEVIACRILQLVLPGAVFPPQSANYTELREVNWAQNTWLFPGCIVQPASAGEVADTVYIVSNLKAIFATRSGGHNANPGWANTNGGVLIDLVNIDELSYNRDKGTVVVGSGRRWLDVYQTLQADGVAVIGGRVAPVGVGGLTLGGGLSYLTHEYGLSCDNVLSFEVVTADGKVINANKDTHPDLWGALKGGTNNFGIVTRFTHAAISIGQVWGGYMQFSHDKATVNSIVDAAYKYQIRGDSDVKSELCIQFIPNDNLIWVNLIYSKPVAWPEIFSEFKKFEPFASINTLSFRSWPDFIAGQPFFEGDTRFMLRTSSMEVDRQLFRDVAAISTEASKAMEPIEGGILVYVFQPISKNVVAQGRAKGGNSLGLRNINQQWLGMATAWNLPKDDRYGYTVISNLGKRIDAHSKSKGKFVDYVFANDASFEQDVIGSYGEANVNRLRRIAKKYDPEAVFQHLEPGGFKLYFDSAAVDAAANFTPEV